MSNKDLTQQEDSHGFTPTPGGAAYKSYHLIPESEKVDDDYDYDKLKLEALKEKYSFE